MLSALKRLKVWQVAVLIVVILGIAGAAYGVYGAVASSPSALAQNTRTVPVQYGNLVKSVSASGSMDFPARASLTFGSAGTVTTVNVEMGQEVSKGAVLAQLGTTDLQRALTKAQIGLSSAQINLDKVLKPYTEADLSDAQGAVRNAQVALQNAQLDLEQTKLNAPLDTELAQITLDSATYTYRQKWDLYGLGRATWADVEQARMTMNRAQATLDLAEQNEAKAMRNAENAVAQAEDTVKRAQANLQKILDAPDPQDVQLAQNQVTTAQIALDEAQQNLEMATMVAPFAGVVASVNITAGQTVGADTAAIELVDPSVVEMDALLNEIDAAGVKPGQKATISVDALPGLQLSGELWAISGVATVTSGIVSYPIIIRVTTPPPAQLRDGMSTTASIVIQEKNGVLLIPNQAIGGSSSKPVVKVMVADKVEERQVKLGVSNYLQTEVVQGLNQGELVVIQSAATTTTSTQTGRTVGIPGGVMGPR